MHADVCVVVGSDAEYVAVFALQGAAGDDDAGGGGGVLSLLLCLLWEEDLKGLLAEEYEPVPSVGVREGDALGHFVYIFGGVELFHV